MITKENFRSVLECLEFTESDDKYFKTYGSGENSYEMAVDFRTQKLEYADGIIAGRDTTKDFHQNENFVVFECVCRLLECGYEPKNIILEATSGVAGRGQTQTYLDILIKDNNGNNYLIIECKTAGKEFEEAWSKVKKNGGQLFNYWTLFGTKHLCLYASDYSSETNKLTYSSNIIIFEKEDQIKNQEEKQKKLAHIENLLKTNPLTKGYKDLDENANQTDYFDVWTDTYGQPELYHGIFEEGCKPYEISEKITLAYDDLKEMEDYEEIQKKYHQFATIMRQHNVGSHENSFDKLVNLFLAKIVDETDNQKELKFNWKGVAFDDYYNFQDRLQQMYSKGMSEFLGEKVEYVSDEQIDNAFKFFAKDTPELSRDEVKKLFHIQKFFTNNDFSFLDVHNEQLFMQNVTILIKVVQMLQGMKLKTKTENQFLGDLFEGFLDQGVKQSEGQFFTPTPIVKFLVSSLPIDKIVAKKNDAPKVIDYACGAGHFLNEVARVIKSEADRQEKSYDTKELYGNIVGIEKEYRLSKVAKVSAFMYSQNEIQIVYGDGLIPHKNVENGSFNILVANPPYSVKGFLETLDSNQKSAFRLYSDKVKTINEATTNSIETFFVERAAQLLSTGGVAAIILPSSILSNANIYTDCRKIILQNFNIIAIAEFGGGTFGKTPTNTVTLFLEKKNYGKLAKEQTVSDEAVQYRNRVNAWFNGDFSKEEFFEDGHYFEEYCKLIETDFKEYQSWILGGDLPKSELFTEYSKKAKNELKKIYNKKINSKFTQQDKDKEIKQKTFALISETEKEKLYYYILSRLNRTKVIVAKSPSDNKEIRSYLGYEWSGAKGSEGIKYLGQNVVDEEDTITKNSGIFGIKTPLFNPADKDDETKICFAIRRNFENKNALNRICEGVELTHGSSLEVHNLCDMIDFNRISFDMQIRTNMPKKEEELKYKDGIRIIKLGDVVDVKIGGTPDRDNSSYFEGNNLWVSIAEMNGQIITDTKEKISEAGIQNSNVKLIKKGTTLLSFKLSIGKTAIAGKDLYTNEAIAGLEVKDNSVSDEYLFHLFNGKIIDLENVGNKAFGKSLNSTYLKEDVKIPIPSKEMQSQIVSECKKLDDEAIKAKQKQLELKENICKIMSNIKGEKKKLSDIYKIGSGGTPLRKNNSYWFEGTIPWVTTSEVVGTVITETKECITQKGLEDSSAKIYPPNSLVIAMYGQGATRGRTAKLGIEACTNQACAVLYEKLIECDTDYIWNALKSSYDALRNNSHGSARQNLTADDIKNFSIVLPSIEEQRKIVIQIKTLESQISDLQKNIDKVPNLKREILVRELLAE